MVLEAWEGLYYILAVTYILFYMRVLWSHEQLLPDGPAMGLPHTSSTNPPLSSQLLLLSSAEE